jgi:hypothetical protein
VSGEVFVNGKSVGSDTYTGLNIGGSVAMASYYLGTANYFKGQLDDVRIYNYALTPLQIKSIMNEGAVRFGPAEGSP